LKIFGFAEYIL